jgi:predicted outer membrane repeat protein
MISGSRLLFRSLIPSFILILLLSLTFAPHTAAASAKLAPNTCIIYVNINVPAGGNGSGSSWANADPNLLNAINNATAGCEIWVAKGTYLPYIPPLVSRLSGFYLKNGVAIYGGFAGGEQNRADRNWVSHVTTLSGDIMQPNDNSDNCYNVVYVYYNDATAILDGFTITAGNATNKATTYVYALTGGGIVIAHSTATLANLTVTANNAIYGGGIDIQYSSPSITNSTINNNDAVFGAGVYVHSQSSPTLSHVNFYNNMAKKDSSLEDPREPGGDGAGLYNDQTSGSLTLTDVFFDGNQAEHSGGGMYNYTAHASLTRVRFDFNHADFGAGMIIDTDSGTALINVEFLGNVATSKGGGLYNYASAPILTNVYFSQNTATYSGGAMGGYASSPTLTNVTFSGNSAPNGGAIYNSQNSHPQVRNSILWGDTGGEIYHDPGFTASTITLTHSLVQGCNPGATWNTTLCGADGGGNVTNADPKFVNPVSYNYRLQAKSPAINRGDNALLGGVTTDMDGHARIQKGVVDLGPYESSFYPLYMYLPSVRK